MRKFIMTVSTIAFLTGAAGCTTTEQSAAVGGLTGAAIGGAATGEVGGAVAGGAVGLMAGALVGQAAERGWCVYENRWGYRYRALCPR
jgi:hypothetical protein